MNISEIAKLAGVSPAAVSRYLNNGYLSQEKKEVIQKVIKETGYIPSTQAQMLRTRKTNVIGVVIPKIDSEAVSRIVSGISETLDKAGYELLLANTDNDIEKELKYLNTFKNNRVDGILFIATMLTPKHKRLLQSITVPVVIIGQHCSYLSSIYHDDFQAARAVTEEMLKKGRKHLAYIGVSAKDKAAGSSRKEGFLTAVLSYQCSIDEARMAEGAFTSESGFVLAKKLFSKDPSIDGLFCATDTIAVGALEYLKQIHKRVPEDVSIVGIGHTHMSTVISPPLTTIHFYYKTSGMEGASMLLYQIAHPDAPVKSVKLGYEIISQESV